MLSAYSREGQVREPVNEEQARESYARLGVVEREMAQAGAWVFSGRLHESDTATVVRYAGGEVLTTDGPFAETKDHLGGFYVVEAADLDAALGWAARVTECIGVPVEVRPFAAFADEPQA
ncbi:YciI family protein [Saccharothrix sp.]|uniref:YciI family protein n=1 Tax=Saccharothrix sp. TaxID=1873460 RepID=UPI002811FD3C|nr:YciI family protein [Saccharothrix sp.]